MHIRPRGNPGFSRGNPGDLAWGNAEYDGVTPGLEVNFFVNRSAHGAASGESIGEARAWRWATLLAKCRFGIDAQHLSP